MRGDKPHPSIVGPPRTFQQLHWKSCAAVIVFAAAISCAAQDKPAAANQENKPAATPPSSQTATPANTTKEQKAAVDGERKKQIADESTQLLSMALALKAEVDKTTKDTLSVNVIRKADEIEKLARTVKEKMKQSSGAS